MADLGTLSLGAFDSGNSTFDGISGTTPPDSGWDISTASDSSYAYDDDNTTADETAVFAIEDVPGDFTAILTLSVNIRYWRDANSADKYWDYIGVGVYSSSGGTLYAGNSGGTGPLIVVGADDGVNNITNTSPANSGATALTITSAGLAASDTAWNGAVVVVTFGRHKNKGGNTDSFRFSALEFTGTYTAGASIVDSGAIALAPSATLAGGTPSIFHLGAATLAPSAGLTATAGPFTIDGSSAALAPAAGLTASALDIALGSASLSASAGLNGTGLVLVQGASDLAPGATLGASSLVEIQGASDLAPSVVLTGTAGPFTIDAGAVALAPAAGLTGTGLVIVIGSGALAPVAGVTASGDVIVEGLVEGTANITVTAGLNATAGPFTIDGSSVAFGPVAGVTAAGLGIVGGSASLGPSAVLTGSGLVIVGGSAGLAATVGLTAAGLDLALGSVTFGATVLVTATGEVIEPGATIVEGTAVLAVTVGLTADGRPVTVVQPVGHTLGSKARDTTIESGPGEIVVPAETHSSTINT